MSTSDTNASPLFKEDRENGLDRYFMMACSGGEEYVDGFRKGFLALGRMITSVNNHDLFFPTSYLFRHYLELRLKDILRRGGAIHKHGHNLAALWEASREIIERSLPHATVESIDQIGSLVSAMHVADPKGDEMRYPARSDNKTPSLQSIPESVDFSHTFFEMDRVQTFLEHWSYDMRGLENQ